MKISLCMIVKNEEKNLSRCLDSIKDVVDEIVIVDTGSDDSTKDIAFQYTDKVYDFVWCDDFAKARNFAFSKAKYDYIMWVDADDILIEKAKFKKVKKELTEDIDIVMMKYCLKVNGNYNFYFYRERIIKNKKSLRWKGKIHEAIPLKGKVIYADVIIEHLQVENHSKRNLLIYEKMRKEKNRFTPREKFYYARELMDNQKFSEAIKEFESFLKMKKGDIENKIEACKDLARCYLKINRLDKVYYSLIRSFNYDVPRRDICYELGNFYYEMKQYNKAIFWYMCTLNCKESEHSNAFILEDTKFYLPVIQLSLCYYYLEILDKAIYYNELIGKTRPKDKIYLFNKKFFESKREHK